MGSQEILEPPSLFSSLILARLRGTSRDDRRRIHGYLATPDTSRDFHERLFGTYTIFEGTSEIQRLVIARAISGIHIK